jgi:uncharacterized protein (DUF2342 family)
VDEALASTCMTHHCLKLVPDLAAIEQQWAGRRHHKAAIERVNFRS